MNIIAEHLSVGRVFVLVIAVRFGWAIGGVLVDQVEHWFDRAYTGLRDRW